MVESSIHYTIDNHSKSFSDMFDYQSIFDNKSLSPKQQFELYKEFNEYMDEEKVFNLENYMDRGWRILKARS